MTKFFGVSAPLGSWKTTAAVEFAGRAALGGDKIAIVQPSIDLIRQSELQFRRLWPDSPVKAIHSNMTNNVARSISEHTKKSRDGEALFVTHPAFLQSPFWDRPEQWHVIIDEAPQVIFHTEISLPVNRCVLLPALNAIPHNVRYSSLIAGDARLLDQIATGQTGDDAHAIFQDVAAKIGSGRWNLFVLSSQWERFRGDSDGDGKLLIFGLLNPSVFERFASVTLMSANLEKTLAYQHLVQKGCTVATHNRITSKIKFSTHQNGNLLTIYYALEEGYWSKTARNREVQIEDVKCTVNDLIIESALHIFGDEDFVWLANKDIESDELFGNRGHQLPHSPHGLNSYQHIHNAAVLAAYNPSPALYEFLDEVGGFNSDEVRRAVYVEATYQAAGRISLRNLDDRNPKRVVVADRAAAEALAELFPGAEIRQLPFADLISGAEKPGRPKKYDTDAGRKAAYRDRKKAELIAQLDTINSKSGETKTPIGYKVFSSLPDGQFGGSVFTDIGTSRAIDQIADISTCNFVGFLKELHTRQLPKKEAFLWSPSSFDPSLSPNTNRGLANITAIQGIWLDNDGGGLLPDEFAALMSNLELVIYNSYSSTATSPRYRVVIPTTYAMTPDVHCDIMAQIMKSLNRHGYFSKGQLEKRGMKGRDGRPHGFDMSKITPSSLFYLPVIADAGPAASFFEHLEGGNRRPIDPYVWIDRSIIDKRPEPESISVPATAVEGLSLDTGRIEQILSDWRTTPKGEGHREFNRMAWRLARAGVYFSEIEQHLRAETANANSPTERRREIKEVMKNLRRDFHRG